MKFNRNIASKFCVLALAGALGASAFASSYTMRVVVPGVKPNAATSAPPVTTPPVDTTPPVTAPSWSIMGTPNTNFGSLKVGASAEKLTVSLKNSGAVGTLATPTFAGDYASEFSATSTCTNVAKNAECAISVGFSPAGGSLRSSTMTFGGLSLVYSGTGVIDTSTLAFLLHGDGANGSTNFVDAAGNATFTNVGAYISTAKSKFGGSSIYLDGASNLNVTTSKLAFGTGDFTIEWWYYYIGDYNGDIYIPVSGGGQPRIRGMAGKVSAFGDGSSGVVATATPNTWQHYAAVRYNGVETLYQDGKAIGTAPNTANYTGTSAMIGRTQAYGYFITAYIDDMRVTREALYKSNFTPPTAPY